MNITRNQFIYIMVGKKTSINKIISLIISSICLLLSSCQMSQHYGYDISNKKITGIYVFNQTDSKNDIVEVDTLVLEEDGTYQFHTYLKHHDMSNMAVCPTIGVWKIKGNTIFLNSITPCGEDSCLIKEFESDNENKDLIIIEMISLSTGMPLTDYTVFSIYNEQYDSLALTDNWGSVAFQRNHTSAIDISDPNGGRIVSPPREGFMYRVYYRDCYLRIHNNQKLIIQKDTLFLCKKNIVSYSKLGKKKYKTFKYSFVKAEEATRKEETPCTTP